MGDSMRGVNSSRVVLSNAPAGVKLSGAYLMNHGIEPELTGDYDSVSFKPDRVQPN
jgi:hypothetical protein